MTIASKFYYFHSRRRRSAASASAAPPEASEPPDRRRNHPRSAGVSRDNETLSVHRSIGEHSAANSSIFKAAVGRSIEPSRRLDEPNRLPDTVQQARERLLRRLRGPDFTDTRERRGSEAALLSGINTLANVGTVDGTECSIPSPQGGVCALGLFTRIVRDVLQGANAVGNSETPSECCICLERFQDGDGLVQLQCNHTFHSLCLEPWMQEHLECPYCRAGIVLKAVRRNVGS